MTFVLHWITLFTKPWSMQPTGPGIVPGKDGFLQLPPQGVPMMLGRMTDGIMRCTARVQSLSDLVSLLGDELERPVFDKTGLTGKYDFTLAYSRDGLQTEGTGNGTRRKPPRSQRRSEPAQGRGGAAWVETRIGEGSHRQSAN